jgi:hypothetical protein
LFASRGPGLERRVSRVVVVVVEAGVRDEDEDGEGGGGGRVVAVIIGAVPTGLAVSLSRYFSRMW